jgi:hypothetical protein
VTLAITPFVHTYTTVRTLPATISALTIITPTSDLGWIAVDVRRYSVRQFRWRRIRVMSRGGGVLGAEPDAAGNDEDRTDQEPAGDGAVQHDEHAAFPAELSQSPRGWHPERWWMWTVRRRPPSCIRARHR